MFRRKRNKYAIQQSRTMHMHKVNQVLETRSKTIATMVQKPDPYSTAFEMPGTLAVASTMGRNSRSPGRRSNLSSNRPSMLEAIGDGDGTGSMALAQIEGEGGGNLSMVPARQASPVAAAKQARNPALEDARPAPTLPGSTLALEAATSPTANRARMHSQASAEPEPQRPRLSVSSSVASFDGDDDNRLIEPPPITFEISRNLTRTNPHNLVGRRIPASGARGRGVTATDGACLTEVL
jgi:hypothetical protein